jgi:hypothetical protein
LASTSLEPFYGCEVLWYQIPKVLRISNGFPFLRQLVGDGGPITIGNRTNLFQALRSQDLDVVIEEHDRARLATGS